MKLPTTAAALMAAAGILGGCADNGLFVLNDPPPHVQRVEYGVVEHIDLFREGQSAPTGLGVILGGLAGGVIGHQIGGGSGNTAATIGGAVVGAVVGNEVHKNQVEGNRYRITVALESGARLSLEDTREMNLRVGDRVRVENNRIYRE